ncbi:MAG: SMC-Scp complex subunit ScpB [Sulfobacillus thermosulfidooxidans]|uniref:SMC-Scp complex subunit ScpB n=1 Tax=Sulfobacillus thermotolerans TaxID=338644 RepID=A0ABN5GZ24_9FIRM|nr:SMC-Scp complex subunit ScpB [Sulfobacillus sp. hq2]AUW93635.1 SMC-Scp complex subunit ScpB [Sulfobacillus thermotolerans]POB10878.1 SMC-Scp complex subunit ScpB [Sulfobacillus sp. hq2]PSR36457.1 MAG: SMC-Scp complex subunit ScpB [Sulfobacillus thermosulfidooxidans]
MDLVRVLEALLFLQPEPVSVEQIGLWLAVSDDEVPKLVTSLANKLASTGSSLTVQTVAGRYRLATAPDLDEFLRTRLRLAAPEPLSAAAWEVLAVIAYRQPITRLEIEAVRQVNSERALETLMARELVEQVGRKDAPGRPILYGTTAQFLKEFGINTIDDLPALPIMANS